MDKNLFPLALVRTIACVAGGLISVRPFILGDSAFPFRPYLMKGFSGEPAEGTREHAFNYCIVCGRRVIENAFGRLKGCFRVLKAAKLNDPEWMTEITQACCALHNMCERRKSTYHDQWFSMSDEDKYKDGNLSHPDDKQYKDDTGTEEHQNALLVKQSLAQYVHASGCY